MSESIATSTSTTPAAAPVQPKERIVLADILRGFALLGVLMINTIIFMGQGHYTGLTNSLDRAAWLFTRFFAQAKFYTMFSFLFGWGMSIQMRRAEERGGRFVPLYARRLLILLLIGLVHAILVWYGDILNNYAVLGFTLLLFRRRSNRFILAAAAICILIPVLLTTPGPMETFTAWYDGLIQGAQDAAQAVGWAANVYATGSYWENVVHRLAELRSGWAGCLYWCTHVIGMFLLGLYAGRRRLLENSAQHLPLFRKLMLGGLIVGLPLNTLWVGVFAGLIDVAPQYQGLATRGPRMVAGSALALAYISILVLLAQRRTWLAWLSKLAPLGRMALSNYLIQSLVFTLAFYGYGLGFYGRFGPAVGLALTLIFYSLQIRFSQWWIDRYQFGPMEWVWRSLTYGRPQPMISQERRQAQEVIQRWSGHR